jgi:hypothetical protein
MWGQPHGSTTDYFEFHCTLRIHQLKVRPPKMTKSVRAKNPKVIDRFLFCYALQRVSERKLSNYQYSLHFNLATLENGNGQPHELVSRSIDVEEKFPDNSNSRPSVQHVSPQSEEKSQPVPAQEAPLQSKKKESSQSSQSSKGPTGKSEEAVHVPDTQSKGPENKARESQLMHQDHYFDYDEEEAQGQPPNGDSQSHVSYDRKTQRVPDPKFAENGFGKYRDPSLAMSADQGHGQDPDQESSRAPSDPSKQPTKFQVLPSEHAMLMDPPNFVAHGKNEPDRAVEYEKAPGTHSALGALHEGPDASGQGPNEPFNALNFQGFDPVSLPSMVQGSGVEMLMQRQPGPIRPPHAGVAQGAIKHSYHGEFQFSDPGATDFSTSEGESPGGASASGEFSVSWAGTGPEIFIDQPEQTFASTWVHCRR